MIANFIKINDKKIWTLNQSLFGFDNWLLKICKTIGSKE
jgi:hypothetical protein